MIFLILAVATNAHDLAKALGRFDLIFLIPVLALSLANYGLRFSRWSLYLRRCDLTVAPRRSVAIFGSGLAMSVTPGKFGELFKCALLKDECGIAYARSVPVVIAERLTDLVAVVLLALIGAARYPTARLALLIAAALVAAGLIVLAWSPTLLQRLGPRLTRRLLRGRDADVGSAPAAAAAFAYLLRGGLLFEGTGLGLVAWLAECAGLYVVLLGLGVTKVSLFAAMFIYAASTLAGALSMLPGGLGATEAGMAGLLVLFALNRDLGVAAVVIVRLCTLWFATALGLMAYLMHRRAWARERALRADQGAANLGR